VLMLDEFLEIWVDLKPTAIEPVTLQFKSILFGFYKNSMDRFT